MMGKIIKKPRKDLAKRIAMLNQIRNYPLNTSYSKLQRITGIPKATIHRLIQQEGQLRKQWEQQAAERVSRISIDSSSNLEEDGNPPICGDIDEQRKHSATGSDTFQDVGEVLNEWFGDLTRRGMRIEEYMFKSRAIRIAEQFGYANFDATDDWLCKWKARYKIVEKVIEKFDRIKLEEWKTQTLPNLLNKFSPKDIYTVDEMLLNYTDRPQKSFSYENESILNLNSDDKKITVLCCANMIGTDKKHLLIVGKTEIPVNSPASVDLAPPMEYYINQSTFLTDEIFTLWISAWIKELKKESRQILLVLDHHVAHPKLQCENIEFAFFPPHTKASLQPMGSRILKQLKINYQKHLNYYTLERMETSVIRVDEVAVEISQVADFLKKSWEELSPAFIQHSFAQCDFRHA